VPLQVEAHHRCSGSMRLHGADFCGSKAAIWKGLLSNQEADSTRLEIDCFFRILLKRTGHLRYLEHDMLGSESIESVHFRPLSLCDTLRTPCQSLIYKRIWVMSPKVSGRAAHLYSCLSGTGRLLYCISKNSLTLSPGPRGALSTWRRVFGATMWRNVALSQAMRRQELGVCSWQWTKPLRWWQPRSVPARRRHV